MITIDIKQIQLIENEMLKETLEILGRHNITFYMCCGSVLGAIRHHGSIPWDTDMDVLIPFNQLEAARTCLEKELSNRFCIDDLKKNKGYKNFFPRVAMPYTSSDTLHIDLFPLMGLPDNRKEQLKLCKKIKKYQHVMIKLKHMRQNIAHPTPVKMIIARGIELFCSPFNKKQLYSRYYRMISRVDYDDATYVMNACGHYGEKNIFEKKVFGNPENVPYCDVKVPIPEQWDVYLKRYYKDYMKLPPEEERNFWMNFKMEIDERDYRAVEAVFEK